MSPQNHADVTIRTVTKKFVRVVVNGHDLGEQEINGGPSLNEFVSKLAAEHGVRNFNVTLAGEPVTSHAVAASSMADHSGKTVGIQAKDQRGLRDWLRSVAYWSEWPKCVRPYIPRPALA